MRCGAFGSWHCGHKPVVAARSESCVRRFDVRVLECLRFGFGMISFRLRSTVYCLRLVLTIVRLTGDRRPKTGDPLQSPERREPRIHVVGLARTRARVAVRPALRTQAGAVLAAQRL